VHVALYFNGRLPVRTYGGTQRIVVWLAQGLAELGHTVSLLAPRGTSSEHARVVPLDPRAMRTPGFDLTPFLPAGADLIHLHAIRDRHEPLRCQPHHQPSAWLWTDHPLAVFVGRMKLDRCHLHHRPILAVRDLECRRDHHERHQWETGQPGRSHAHST